MSTTLFAPQNLLEHCVGLQEVIAAAPADEKQAAGDSARSMVHERDIHYYGAHWVELHTLGALALPDRLTLESEVFPVIYYPEMRLKGRIGNVSFIHMQRLNCLAWMITDTVIRSADSEVALPPIELDANPEMLGQTTIEIGKPLQRALYVPVGDIQSVLIAA